MVTDYAFCGRCVGVDRVSPLLRWRWDGFAAQEDPGAGPVGEPGDADGVHAGVHEGDAPAPVFVVDWWRAPAAVVAHDDGGLALPAGSRLDCTADVH